MNQELAEDLNPAAVPPPVLALLEPCALDLWRSDIASWLPQQAGVRIESRRTFFGGLYQLVVLVRE